MSADPRVIAPSGSLVPFDSHRLAALAERGTKLNETIRDRATHPDKRKVLRTIPGTEAVNYLGGLNVETLYRRLKRNPDLPQGIEVNKRRRDFSLEQLHALQDAFGIRPRRAPGQSGIVLNVCNLKGGVGKTTTTAHLGQYLNLQGYRVCMIDLDAQASLTQLFGILPHLEVPSENTIRPIMDGPYLNDEPFGVADDLTEALVRAMRDYVDRRDQPAGSSAYKSAVAALEAFETHRRKYGPTAPKTPNPEYRSDFRQYAQKTHWHDLDLIPSNLAVYGSEFSVASRIAYKEADFAFYRPLADHMWALREVYDVILMDTAPSLSFMNSNAMFAADALLITLPPAPMDVASVALFFELMAEVVGRIDRVEEHPKQYDFGNILLTKYIRDDDSHQEIATWVREFYRPETLKNEMVHTRALEKMATELLTLYEAEATNYPGDRRTFERAVDAMNRVNAEVEGLIRKALDARALRAGVIAQAAVAPSSGALA